MSVAAPSPALADTLDAPPGPRVRDLAPPLSFADLDGADTFPKLIARNARLRPHRPAIRHKDYGIWRTWSWAELDEIVRAYACGLKALGLTRGDRIAVVGTNRPKLYWTVMAAQVLGAVPVPVYADAVADELTLVLAHAETRFAAVEDQEQVDKLLQNAAELPGLEGLLYDEPRGLRDYDLARLHAIDAVIADGRERLVRDPAEAARIEAEIARGHADDLSIILYTSGTTGRPKGVMLAAGQSIRAAADTVAFDGLIETDEVLAYLPIAWVGDHYMSYAQGMVAGFCTACPESPETAESDLKEIGPSFYFAPPRVFEGLLTRVMIRMEDAGALKRRLFHAFLDVAKRHGERLLNGQSVPLSGRLLYGLGTLLVYAPLKNALGLSRVRVAYTAGEAIGPELFSFYRSLGLNLKQLYGQTEAFLYVTAQPNGRIRADTVGPPAPHVEIRIEESGEVLFRSPGQFVGYFKEPDKTAETKTEDGFVRTGDAGFFDADGDLRIIDRAKDVGKLADGSLFPPKYVENKLKFFPNIKEAVAYGNGREFVACLLNIDLAAVGNWAERNGVIFASYQELTQHPQVVAMIERDVDAVNRLLAAEPAMARAQVRRFLILHKELDADDGELTRTQKVRRGFIAERYAPLIDALYNGSAEADIATEVTFEDGRKGVISARIKVRDMQAYPAAGGAPPAPLERAA